MRKYNSKRAKAVVNREGAKQETISRKRVKSQTQSLASQ
jgi:hypothetical protein